MHIKIGIKIQVLKCKVFIRFVLNERKNMSWTEIIMVRSSGKSQKAMASNLRELMNEMDRKNRNANIRIYKRERIDSDICIILIHDREKRNIGKSHLGLRIAAAFAEKGQVHHTVWIEMDQKSNDP